MPEERKLVTVLFADIVGSTALTVARDPELVRAMLRRTFDALRPILESHGATVEKFIGDEVMAVFGVPVGHDDDADRAVRAAFAIRQRVRELSALPKAIPLELRIGINSGETVTDASENGQFLVTGEPVNAAARIRGSAEPGEIVVGALTRRLTSGAVEYGESRSFEAKGLGQLTSWPALALRSDVPTQFRGIEGLRAPLIGRAEELSLLLNAFARMRNEERPHLITVFGAAGAGKSRLTEEFLARIDGACVRQGRCLPYGESITLWPIQMILRADAGIAPSDDLAAARQRLHDSIVAAFPDAADEVDAVERRLGVLAGLARADEVLPEIAATDLSDELAWALRRYFERRATSEPIVLVFEDIHWAAAPLLDLIEHLAQWAKGPLFLLCLARPDFLEGRPGWGGGKVNAASLVLEPLTPDETRELVAKLLDLDSLTDEVRSAVIERAEGNPLYIEEFIRLLIDSGQIAQHDGKWVATSLAPLQVPRTLQGLIAARIDTAPPEVKVLLQRASVIGRFFVTTGVAALSDGRVPESTQLRDAVRRDLLVDADERGLGGGRVYRFKHVLVRDVAYASVPKTERAILHDRFVRWYEDTLGDRREEFIELIAHHAEQAYLLASEMAMPEATAFARHAFERLLEAATKARTRQDQPSALSLYSRAAAAADDAEVSESQRLEVDAYRALARHLVEASHVALAEVDRVLERARASGDAKLVLALLGSRYGWFTGEERERAQAELRTLALASSDPEDVVRGLLYRITRETSLAQDIEFLTEALQQATEHGLRTWQVGCLDSIASRLRAQGRFSDSERHVAAHAQLLGLSPTRRERASLLYAQGEELRARWQFEAALPLLREAAELFWDLGSPRAYASSHLRVVDCLDGLARHAEAAAEASVIAEAVEGRMMPAAQLGSRAKRVRAVLKLGHLEEARSFFIEVEELRTHALAFEGTPFVRYSSTPWIQALLLAAERDLAGAATLLEGIATGLTESGEVIPALTFDRADILFRAGRQAEARGLLEALKAQLTDPLAERIHAKADQMLAELAAARA